LTFFLTFFNQNIGKPNNLKSLGAPKQDIQKSIEEGEA
jgi:hypothetical protein